VAYDDAFDGDGFRVLVELGVAFFTVVGAAGHHEFLFVGLLQFRPEVVGADFLAFVGEGLAGSASEIFDGFVRLSANDVFVAAIGLSVGFLKQNDPEFLISFGALAEDQSLAVWFNGNVSIDFDEPPIAVDAQPDKKVPVLQIDVFENSFDEVVVLCEAGKRAKEVAVSQFALADVVGADALVEQFGSLEHLRVVFPFEEADIFDGRF
jgi:hypothetical protein